MADPDNFFDDVYKLTSLEQSAAHYAKFAEAYEEAMNSNGYITPKRCSEALAGAGADKTQPVLDVGCGSLAEPAPDRAETYPAACAAGVLNPAHAPAEALDTILEMLTPSGLFVFSLNDHAIKDHTYEGRLNTLIDCGTVDLLFREYGEHMPGQDLKAWVYVLNKR